MTIIHFLNTMGSLNKTKSLIVSQFYDSTRYPKPYLHCQRSDENHLCLQDIQRESVEFLNINLNIVYDFQVSILKLEYHHPRQFLRAFMTKG